MGDESAKRAAEEYLAAKLSAETQSEENRLNREAAERLATSVWKRMADTVTARCKEWNEVAGEQVLTCRETMLGDLRILCAGRPHQLVVHFDSRKPQIILKNSARLSHETDMILLIEGYSTGRERSARLMRNDEPVNLDMLLVGELRVLAGLSRRA
jgi:hypothetical protein